MIWLIPATKFAVVPRHHLFNFEYDAYSLASLYLDECPTGVIYWPGMPRTCCYGNLDDLVLVIDEATGTYQFDAL